jgi:ribose 1,5-bisphosphate isomerase
MSVEESAGKIESMEIRGALRIAIAAAQALEAEIIGGASYDDIVAAGDKLKDARPTAVSLPNAVNYIIHLAQTHKTDDPSLARALLLADVAEYIKTLEESRDKVAEYGSHLVSDGDVILTICNSDNVAAILKRAWEQGRRFKVYACETRPRWQGRITYDDLSSAGVDVTLIVDSAAYHTMINHDVKKVFVGADTVYANGDVINKIGTSQVALLARQAGCEFIVATPTVKFSPYSIHGQRVLIEERDKAEVWDNPQAKIFNPAFDLTSKEHVGMIVTEHGIISPEAVYHEIIKHFRWVQDEQGS